MDVQKCSQEKRMQQGISNWRSGDKARLSGPTACAEKACRKYWTKPATSFRFQSDLWT